MLGMSGLMRPSSPSRVSHGEHEHEVGGLAHSRLDRPWETQWFEGSWGLGIEVGEQDGDGEGKWKGERGYYGGNGGNKESGSKREQPTGLVHGAVSAVREWAWSASMEMQELAGLGWSLALGRTRRA